MIHNKQRERLVRKIQRLAAMADPFFFTPVQQLDNISVYQTEERLYQIPSAALYSPVKPGDVWGSEGSFAWFHAECVLQDDFGSMPVYIRPYLGGYEGMLYVDGCPKGAFAEKIVVTTHGNHYCCLMDSQPYAGKHYTIDLEYYAGHHVPGTQPFDKGNGHQFCYPFEKIELCIKNQPAIDFSVSLKALLEIYHHALGHPYRKEELYYFFEQLNSMAPYALEQLHTKQQIQNFFEQANALMEPLLQKHSCESDGRVFFTGHSHMDTAWLWPRAETTKKCGRTIANALNYMEQYPEYRFLFSSAYHAQLIKEHYPSLYDSMKQRIQEGRLEPNGGCFIESDCNITGGESLVRQFLWAQRFTQQEFGYLSDCFWLPDTFGYSASIPQIMKGCGLDYFLTTKLSWNDTNRFPYESFWWKGIDGTKVLTHFNITQDAPSPAYTIASIKPIENHFKTGTRFFAFGQGDGGGGPEFEMIESARRSCDILGAPKGEYSSVSNFMKQLQQNQHLPTYEGELYLELHRATLTNQPAIKKNNRRAEILHRNFELLLCLNALQKQTNADIAPANAFLKTILINQFHDILPGTCIQSAHQECMTSMQQTIEGLEQSIEAILHPCEQVVLFNPLGFARQDTAFIWMRSDRLPTLPNWQIVRQEADRHLVAIDGIHLEGFSAVTMETQPTTNAKVQPSAFCWEENRLETPFYLVEFDQNGTICSLYDKESKRFISSDEGGLGGLVVCENVPAMWDSWDIDADAESRFRSCLIRSSLQMENNGSVLCSFRADYAVGPHTNATVKTTFYAHSRAIDFDTTIHAQDANLFIGAEFYNSIATSVGKFEIQYGHVQRPLHQNDFAQQAAFEVCHHKYCDVSEAGYGLSLLNDCKYGVHPRQGLLRLSLHYGATHPDASASFGTHTMRYRLLPHVGTFSAKTTVQPAYCFNFPALLADENALDYRCPLSVQQPNIIIESVKPCEDAQKAIIVRLYEAEGCRVQGDFLLDQNFRAVEQVNMLETALESIRLNDHSFQLPLSPFEIITLKLYY